MLGAHSLVSIKSFTFFIYNLIKIKRIFTFCLTHCACTIRCSNIISSMASKPIISRWIRTGSFSANLKIIEISYYSQNGFDLLLFNFPIPGKLRCDKWFFILNVFWCFSPLIKSYFLVMAYTISLILNT